MLPDPYRISDDAADLAVQAFQIGKRQAEGEAAAIQAAWTF
ncbi:hypothetical protein ACFWP5_02575 [Streptomyces sp. NPDC058469]